MKLVKVMNPVKQMRIIKLGRMMILVMMLKLVNKLGVRCAELSLARLGKDSLGKGRLGYAMLFQAGLSCFVLFNYFLGLGGGLLCTEQAMWYMDVLGGRRIEE